jgi:hypothetical protein
MAQSVRYLPTDLVEEHAGSLLHCVTACVIASIVTCRICYDSQCVFWHKEYHSDTTLLANNWTVCRSDMFRLKSHLHVDKKYADDYHQIVAMFYANYSSACCVIWVGNLDFHIQGVCLRMGCRGRYLDLRGMKWQLTGENCRMRSFLVCVNTGDC